MAELRSLTHNHTNASNLGQLTDAALSAPVGAAKGGTGQTTFASGDLLVATGPATLSRLAKGSAGQFLQAGDPPAWAQPDHGGLAGLSDDDHPHYALLGGRAGGQTVEGDTAGGGNLTLKSTHHATKGSILFGTSRYDEATNRLGIGMTPSLSSGLLQIAGSLSMDVGAGSGGYIRWWRGGSIRWGIGMDSNAESGGGDGSCLDLSYYDNNGANGTRILLVDRSTGYYRFGDGGVPAYRIELPNTASAAGQGRANSWATYSSLRWKAQVTPAAPDDLLASLRALKPLRFRPAASCNPRFDAEADYTAEELTALEDENPEQVGLAAEDLHEVLPEACAYDPDGQPGGILWDRVTAALVGAVQALEARLVRLEGA